jgi:hypothetical protein
MCETAQQVAINLGFRAATAVCAADIEAAPISTKWYGNATDQALLRLCGPPSRPSGHPDTLRMVEHGANIAAVLGVISPRTQPTYAEVCSYELVPNSVVEQHRGPLPFEAVAPKKAEVVLAMAAQMGLMPAHVPEVCNSTVSNYY